MADPISPGDLTADRGSSFVHCFSDTAKLALALVSLIAFAITASPITGLDPHKALTQFQLQQWTQDDGLPQSSVQDILLASDGFLWVATQEGLARFDGVRFDVFDKSNTPAITHHNFSCLAEGPPGVVWAGHDGGLVRWSAGETTAVALPGLENRQIRSLHMGEEDELWIGSRDGGLGFLRDGQLTVYTTADGLAHDRVWAVRGGVDGEILIATDGGLSRWHDDQLTTWTTTEGLADQRVNDALRDGDGTLWAATQGGLCSLQDLEFTCRDDRHGLAERSIYTLLEDHHGALWIGTNGGGLNRLFAGELATLDEANGLPGNLMRTLREDHHGNLWIGSAGTGLLQLVDGLFTTWSTREGLSYDGVYTVFEDRQGVIWIGTFGGGLNRFEKGRTTVYTTADGLPGMNVWSLAEDHHGALWIGTYGNGLSRLQNGDFTTFTTADGLSNDFVRAILEDRQGDLWIATRQGLNRLREGRFTAYNAADGLGVDSLYGLALDSLGRLLIATDGGGLRRFDGTTFSAWTTAEGLSEDRLFDVYEDRAGTLWLGTVGSGLNRLRDGQVTVIDSRVGLFDDNIYRLLEDELGFLWMSCNKGIFRVAKSELEAFARGEIERVHSVVYGREDGLKSREANGGSQPAGYKTRDGRLLFPTLGGWAEVDPKRALARSSPPSTVISELWIDGQRVDLINPAAVGVPAGSRALEMHYTAPALQAAATLRFRYRLTGYEGAWNDVGQRREAYFTHLPPGDYHFEVSSSYDGEDWSPPGAGLSLTLEPFFYQTTTFYLLVVMATVLLVILGHQLRVRGLKAREVELEKRVTAALAQLKVLRGILPICASCSRIRDQRGDWSKLETYVQEHSHAQFSHGICPQCSQKLYGDFLSVTHEKETLRP